MLTYICIGLFVIAVALRFLHRSIETEWQVRQMVVLAAIKLNGQNAYGVSILDSVSASLGCSETCDEMSFGELYAHLDEMKRKGWISDYIMPGGIERGLKNKRHWYLTRMGEMELEKVSNCAAVKSAVEC